MNTSVSFQNTHRHTYKSFIFSHIYARRNIKYWRQTNSWKDIPIHTMRLWVIICMEKETGIKNAQVLEIR
jgi:hypothetical protein